jgi:hypothetical protein
MRAIHRKAMKAAVLVALLLAAHPASWLGTAFAAPSSGDPVKSQKLFAAEAALPVTLTAPWRDFTRNKNSKKRYPGTLEYTDESGAKRSMPVAFEPRGHNRLKVCKYPPIKLIFEKDAIKDTPFRGNKSLKLVTHCGSDDRSEQYITREMLAYRIYNLVTERSFRVRAVTLTYADSVDHARDGPQIAFLVEDDSEMARRNGLEKLDLPRLDLAQLEPLEASRFALFEYLIGNTDFAQLNGPTPDRCCHNSVSIGANPQSKLYTVPYDFDSSGLVDAHYAVPNPVLKIGSNRDRVYRGFCVNNASLETARGEFLRLEPQILELARSDGRLAAGSKEAVREYLSKGFEILRDDAKFAGDVTAKCRK